MKKLFAAVAAGVAALAISGCAVPSAANTAPVSPAVAAQQAAEKLQSAVTAACNVIQPTIQPFTIILNASPGFSTFDGDVNLACSINSTLNLTSINSIIDSSTTAAQTAVGGISSLNSTDQALIKAAIGAFQGSLKNALTQYKSTLAAAASASTPAAAPIAASQ